MNVALGAIHRIRINGRLLADQGNFDPYFTSRAERYDITDWLKEGGNVIEVEARDTGAATGLLLDGLVELEDGSQLPFVSDTSFQPPAGPAHTLPGPAHGYMGDPALLLLYPRPHPLPEAGWLVDAPQPPEPFDRLVYAVAESDPQPAWYRLPAHPQRRTGTDPSRFPSGHPGKRHNWPVSRFLSSQ